MIKKFENFTNKIIDYIDIDGQNYPTTNSNGEYISDNNLSEKLIYRT